MPQILAGKNAAHQALRNSGGRSSIQAMAGLPTGRIGKVYLVGAGPGDPTLITLRAVRCLQQADCVLVDYLVNPKILRHARRSAEILHLGKQHGESRWSQEQINRELVRRGSQGQVVVRLKGGDPLVFGRLAEETRMLVDQGIPFEIVPGITAAFAAGAYAGIPVTHRDLASAVALITGQERSEKSDSALDFHSLAHFPGTLVFYMGVTTADRWSTQLIQAGKPPETPAAIVRCCSLPSQRTVRCRLDQVADRFNETPGIRPPAIVMVGPAVGVEEAFTWFEHRRLFGQTIVVTRPEDQADVLADRLVDEGAEVLIQPAIEIADPPDLAAVDRSIAELAHYAWVVFSSVNGVQHYLDRMLQNGRDLRALGGVKLACIGPGTAEALSRYHLTADLIPEEFRAESLAASLSKHVAGRRVLLVRASRGREVLAQQLSAAGGRVDQVVTYISRDAQHVDPAIHQRLRQGRIDWITVTSSAIARSLANLFGDELRHTRLVSISPITTATLADLGFQVAAEADTYTMEGVVQAILNHARIDPQT